MDGRGFCRGQFIGAGIAAQFYFIWLMEITIEREDTGLAFTEDVAGPISLWLAY